MEALNDQEAQELIDKSTSDRNHSPYRENPFHSSIDHERIYFYYVTHIEEDVEPIPKVYIFDAPRPMRYGEAVRQAIEDLAQNAALDGTRPRPIGKGFDFIKWTMRSLIVIVIDFPNVAGYDNWKFWHNRGIVFHEGGGYKPNHTFYDAFDYGFTVKDRQGRSKDVTALCFENHMAGEDRRPLGAGEEKFKYDLFAGPESRIYRKPIDPGGTNLGPPPDVP